MAAASVTPPGSLDVLQPGFSKSLLGTKLEDKYLCSACRNVLRRPFQAQCGHRYCSFCLSSILSSGPQNCAACVHEGIYEEGISILESSSAFPDNAARREVESLPAVCPSEGCTWKGTLKEYESCHEGHCPFMLTECPACKGLVRLGDKDHHAEYECPERSLRCRHCRAPCCWADMKAHDEVCPKFPLTCDGCGKKKIPREKFQDHVRTCGKCQVPCRFHDVGCPDMVSAICRGHLGPPGGPVSAPGTGLLLPPTSLPIHCPGRRCPSPVPSLLYLLAPLVMSPAWWLSPDQPLAPP